MLTKLTKKNEVRYSLVKIEVYILLYIYIIYIIIIYKVLDPQIINKSCIHYECNSIIIMYLFLVNFRQKNARLWNAVDADQLYAKIEQGYEPANHIQTCQPYTRLTTLRARIHLCRYSTQLT